MFSILSNIFGPTTQSVKEEFLAPEHDKTDRSATIHLHSRVIDDLAGVEGSSGRAGSCHHWALVAHFEDDSYRILEGVNSDGYLHAAYSKQRADGMTELKNLGTVVIAPFRLGIIARSNKLNGTRYDLLSNNCQDWAISAAKDISKYIGDKAAGLMRFAPFLSVSRNTFVGSGLVETHDDYEDHYHDRYLQISTIENMKFEKKMSVHTCKRV